MKKTTRWITRTAILLALTLAFQSLRAIIPKVTVPGMGFRSVYNRFLVNACLIIAAIIWGGGG